MQLHFILNPNAGNGRGKKIWARFKQQITLKYEIHETQFAGHAQQIAEKIAQHATEQNPICLIAIGGDGTVHELLNGIAAAKFVCIGAIAAGSGNDFARGYAVFYDALQLESFIALKAATFHDYGIVQINDKQKLFVNNFGIGFDALVANLANESMLKKRLNKLKLGKLSYPYFVMDALFTFKPFQVIVVHNGQQHCYKNVWFVTISNQPYFGGGMNLSPLSNTADGKFEVTIVSNLSKWKLFFLFGSVFFAKHTQLKEVYQFETTEIHLQLSESIMAHADGERQLLEEGENHIAITVSKKAWQLAK